jgi:chemotaxis protein MotB
MAKKKAAAHHGGAWKVAYADFVTAMMALFMVLWISSQDKKILVSTSHYFQRPFDSPFNDHSGIMPFNKDAEDGSGSRDNNDSTGGAQSNNAQTTGAASSNSAQKLELNFLNSVASEVSKLIRVDENFDQKPIDVQVTSDGLRITLYDRAKQPLFSSATTNFTPWGKFVMQNLAWLIDRHHFRVTIDGHTRAHLDMPKPEYTAWELSADRANAARRSLVYYAVDPTSIERVTGYADTRPMADIPADSESNQRITLSLSLSSKKVDPDSKGPAEAKTASTNPDSHSNQVATTPAA